MKSSRKGMAIGKGSGYKNMIRSDPMVHRNSGLGKNTYSSPTEKKLLLTRVSYGEQKTPFKDREYVANSWGSPVGTKKEWMNYAKEKKLELEFKETPKKMIFVNQPYDEKEKTKEIIKTEKLIDLLPHGSGIDMDWSCEILKNGNMVCSNSFHNMDEAGYYSGWTDFKVILFKHDKDVLNPLKGVSEGKTQVVHRKGDVDFKITCKDPMLRDYLNDTISVALEEVTKKRGFEIL